MSGIYYVDTAISVDGKKRGKNKTHTVFDGERTFRVRRLTELEDAAEIFIDALFPLIYEEVEELIGKSVKVYLLKNARLVKRLREGNGLRKSDDVDARLLRMIPRNYFKQLTAREVDLLRLIGEYEMYVRWEKTIRQWMRTRPLDLLKECAKRLRCLVNQHARRKIEEVKADANHVTTYRLACGMIGVKDSVEVAILVVDCR